MLAVAFSATFSYAQTCTITGFDVCTGANPVTSFTNATLVSGTALANGAKYKFNNVTASLGSLDAIITIDNNSNATLLSFDDDNATDETGVAGTQAALFSPKIASSSDLKNNAQVGYVQFTITFYLHYEGNTVPPVTSLPTPVANLNFLHFDMDGYKIGTNGYFREMGFVKMPSLTLNDLLNYGAANSELVSGGMASSSGDQWRLTYGSTVERVGISRCAQVIEKSVYALPQSSVTFRMGYDYKPPTPYANQNSGKPQRQYGSKFGCFSIPVAAILPVSLLNFAVNYNNGVANLSWTTAQEINLDRYQVYRSIDGINFQPIGSLVSRNSLAEQKYVYADNKLPADAAVVYYKLGMIDKDNSQKFSNIVSVKINASYTPQEMTIFPNPSSTNAQLRFKAGAASTATILIYDASGKMIMHQQATILAGNNNVSLNNITQLNEGMYTVKMVTAKAAYSTKLIVWK